MTTLAEALHLKYEVEDSKDACESGDFVIFAPKAGFLQCVPHTLIISSSGVSKAGDPEQLSKYLVNATELDISGNNFSDLEEIGQIFKASPKLKIINLGFNKLLDSCSPPINFQSDSLHTLILVGTRAKWQTIWGILRQTKNVHDLHLSLNEYDKIERDEMSEKFGVKTLMFDDNPISDWGEVSKLGSIFPNLRLLSLTTCPIKTIPSEAHSTFPSLKELWMSNSLISEMDDLKNLKHFPALTNLRINGVPFMKDFSEEKRRQHIIALLPIIKVLNRGREISEDERETAERNFIRHYLDKEDPPERYRELSDKHGEVPKLANINLKPPSKVNLIIHLEEKEITRMPINLKMTVKELKDLLEPIVGLHTSKMDLYYFDVDGNWRDIMKFQGKHLYTYNMQENDQIIVRHK